jgi:integrase
MQPDRNTRRPYGSGSLVQRRGKWYGKWWSDGRQVLRALGPLDMPRKQAERELRRRMDAEAVVVEVGDRRTVEDLGEPYIAHLEVKGRKRSTVETYRSMLRVHLGPHFADKPLVKITTADVESYLARALATRSVKTARNELGLLHGIFEFAQRRGVATRNPCRAVDKPEAPARDADIRFLDLTELEALLRAVPDDHLGAVERVLYLTAATTGMRQGELLGLRWMDVDWPGRRIRVRRSYVRGEHGTPKSKRSSRAVPLVDRVGGELDRLYRASRYQADEDLVFAHPHTGRPLDRSKVLRRFKRCCQRVGLRRVRFHDLRHTFGTRMAAQGVPMRTIQEMMGHRDFKTTLIYADYAPGAHESDWAEQAFAPPESQPDRLDTNLDTNLSEPSETERN